MTQLGHLLSSIETQKRLRQGVSSSARANAFAQVGSIFRLPIWSPIDVGWDRDRVAGPAILWAEDNRPPPKTALSNEPVPIETRLIF
jgi:hypothetical protein